jgi:predicted GNAT family acetyltransferase
VSHTLVRTLTPSDGAALETFLAPRLPSSIFLVSNMRLAGLVDHGQRYQGTYMAVFDGLEILAVAAHYWNGMLILQAPEFLDLVVVAAAQQSVRKLKGLIGLEDQVQNAKKCLDLVHADYQIDEADGLYSLSLDALVVPEQLRTGQLHGRRLKAEDLDLVTSWRVAYSVELLGSVENQDLWDESRESMKEKLRTGESWVLEEDGEVVANTSFNAAVREAVQIGGVYTPPELRGWGYGRAVVASSLLDARNEGVEKAVLFTGDANVPARKAYAALGFRRIGNYRLSILRDPVS